VTTEASAVSRRKRGRNYHDEDHMAQRGRGAHRTGGIGRHGRRDDSTRILASDGGTAPAPRRDAHDQRRSRPSVDRRRPLTNRIYVANINDDTVSVISSRSHRVLATVRLGGTPNDLAVDPRAGKVYVSMFAGSPVDSRPRVLVISGRTDKIIATVKISADGMSPNPLTGNIWLTEPAAGQVAVLSGRTYKVISAARVGQNPSQVVLNPLTGAGYAANTSSDTVSVLRWHLASAAG